MGHKRVKMELIKKEKARMLTFRKRKASLLKKASEFSILCGVDACVIIFGPKQNNQPVEADTWPSNSNEVMRIINRFKKSNQPRRSYNISDYFDDKRKKVNAALEKLRKQIGKAKYPTWDNRLNYFLPDQLRVLQGQLDAKIEIVDRKLAMIKENQLMMETKAPWMQATSQLSQNDSYDMEKHTRISNNNKYSNTFLQLLSNPKSSDVQLPISSQHKQNHNMILFNPISMERSPNNGYSNNLQPVPGVKPLNFPLRTPHFQPKQNNYWTPSKVDIMEDVIMKLLHDPNNSNQLGGSWSNSNSPYIPYEEMPYVSRSSASWMWENMMFKNGDASMSYDVPTMQSMSPPIQFPMSGFPHQILCPQANDFTGDTEFAKSEQN